MSVYVEGRPARSPQRRARRRAMARRASSSVAFDVSDGTTRSSCNGRSGALVTHASRELRPPAVQPSCVAYVSSCMLLPAGGTGERGSGRPALSSLQQRSTNGAMSGAASNAYTSHGVPPPHASVAASGTRSYSRSVLHQLAPMSMKMLRPLVHAPPPRLPRSSPPRLLWESTAAGGSMGAGGREAAQ
eukprot:3155220-Prymnesium_polylepis.1